MIFVWLTKSGGKTIPCQVNLDNSIKIYDFSKVSINFLYAALSGGTLLPSVMSQQNLSSGTVH